MDELLLIQSDPSFGQQNRIVGKLERLFVDHIVPKTTIPRGESRTVEVEIRCREVEKCRHDNTKKVFCGYYDENMCKDCGLILSVEKHKPEPTTSGHSNHEPIDIGSKRAIIDRDINSVTGAIETERFMTIGGTTYRFVGNIPDPDLDNFWDRLHRPEFAGTTRRSWLRFLRGSKLGRPEPWRGHTREELEAEGLVSVWSAIDSRETTRRY